MSTIDPGQKQVISHIDDAKNWLDEAKEEYLQSNRVRGELNLNLAQAEVKYAWELSRNQNVTQNNQSLPLKRPNYYLPAVAASIVFLLGLASMLYFGARPEKTGSVASTVKREVNQAGETPVSHKQPELAKNEPLLAAAAQEVATKQDTGPASVSSKDKLQSDKALKDSTPNPPVEIVKTEVVVAGKTNVLKKPLTPREQVASKSVTTHKVAPVSNVAQETRNPGGNAIVLENVPEQAERESSGVQTSTKPAPISLVIDEEALTKEASYSLRNGK